MLKLRKREVGMKLGGYNVMMYASTRNGSNYVSVVFSKRYDHTSMEEIQIDLTKDNIESIVETFACTQIGSGVNSIHFSTEARVVETVANIEESDRVVPTINSATGKCEVLIMRAMNQNCLVVEVSDERNGKTLSVIISERSFIARHNFCKKLRNF